MNQLGVTVRNGAVVVGPNLGPDALVRQLTDDGLPDDRVPEVGPDNRVPEIGPVDQVPPVTLAVSGGLLTWPWHVGAGGLDPDATLTRAPVAVLEDVTSAQEWLWALYGRDAALAAADAADPTTVCAPAVDWAPGLGWLPATAARFAFGTWLSAWWPASTTDGIPALDPATLRTELEALGARLDLLVDGADLPLPDVVAVWRPAPDRYALAAGPADDGPSAAVGVSVSTGSGGTRWSDLPAGWVDASDLAVSWRLLQDLDHWSLRVRAAAGPVVVAAQARLLADAPGRRVELRPDCDPYGRCWLGESTGTDPGPAPEQVRVYLPGFAPDHRAAERWQESVRALARARLATGTLGPAAADLWQAERAAADDDDY